MCTYLIFKRIELMNKRCNKLHKRHNRTKAVYTSVPPSLPTALKKMTDYGIVLQDVLRRMAKDEFNNINNKQMVITNTVETLRSTVETLRSTLASVTETMQQQQTIVHGNLEEMKQQQAIVHGNLEELNQQQVNQNCLIRGIHEQIHANDLSEISRGLESAKKKVHMNTIATHSQKRKNDCLQSRCTVLEDKFKRMKTDTGVSATDLAEVLHTAAGLLRKPSTEDEFRAAQDDSFIQKAAELLGSPPCDRFSGKKISTIDDSSDDDVSSSDSSSEDEEQAGTLNKITDRSTSRKTTGMLFTIHGEHYTGFKKIGCPPPKCPHRKDQNSSFTVFAMVRGKRWGRFVCTNNCCWRSGKSWISGQTPTNGNFTVTDLS